MLFDQIDEVIEQVTAVVRTRRAFGVVLNRESRLICHSDAFYRIIVQVHVCNLDVFSLLNRLRINPEAMVLRGYFAFAGKQVLNRVVEATVTMVHFIGINFISQGY